MPAKIESTFNEKHVYHWSVIDATQKVFANWGVFS